MQNNFEKPSTEEKVESAKNSSYDVVRKENSKENKLVVILIIAAVILVIAMSAATVMRRTIKKPPEASSYENTEVITEVIYETNNLDSTFYDNINLININTSRADIIIEEIADSNYNYVEVIASSGKKRNRQAKIDISKYNDGLFIEQGNSKNLDLSIIIHSVADNDYPYELLITNTYGDIELENLYSVKNLEIESSSGDIELENITAEKIKTNIQNGDQSFEHVKSSELIEATSTSGDLSLDNIVTKELKTSTKTGDISMNYLESAKLYVQSFAGDIYMSDIQTQLSEIIAEMGDITAKNLNTSNLKAYNTVGDQSFYLTNENDIEIDCNLGTGDLNMEFKYLEDAFFETDDFKSNKTSNNKAVSKIKVSGGKLFDKVVKFAN